MNYSTLTSPKELRKILEKYHFNCKKYLGQNFLIDQNILKIIVHSLEPEKEDCILEIGTGIGTLSTFLSPVVREIVTIEKDRSLMPIIQENLSSFDNVKVILADVMKLDFNEIFRQNMKRGNRINKIVGNLPYYISIPIIRKIFELGQSVKVAVFLVQKEVGDRLMAQPGEKDYGILSIAAQYYSTPCKVHLVPATVFYPKPKVSSMIIKMQILENPQINVEDEKLFFEIVRASFQQRRKKILNSLGNYFDGKIDKIIIEESLKRNGIGKDRRAETLSIEEFGQLSRALKGKINKSNFVGNP